MRPGGNSLTTMVKKRKEFVPKPVVKAPIIYLYQLKRGDKIWAHTSRVKNKTEEVTFDHTDGMYSYNTLPDGEVVHLSRFTPLTKVDDHYEIAFDRNEDEK
jgi:hypothetical protein